MKALFYILLFNISVISFAQDPQLFENDWYLQKIVIDGQDIFPPHNSEIENVTLEFLKNPYYMSTWACSSIATDILLINNESFEVNGFAIIFGECALPETILFENYYFNDFYDWQNPNSFNYLIETGTNDAKSLTLTNEDGNQAIYGDAPLSVSEAENNRFSIYPNPVKNELFLSSKNSTENLNIKIFNVAGKLLSTQNMVLQNQASLDVSELSSGMYFLKIEDKNGKAVVKKFVKQ